MESHGFTWLGSSDPVHFDHTAGGTVDLSGYSVQAFQQLWNLNHPEDPISTDGAYGPQTEARLKLSPAEGFARPLCEGGTSSSGGTNTDGGYADIAPVDLVDLLASCACGTLPKPGMPLLSLGVLGLALAASRRGRRS
jgi:hypothetical protein